MTLQPIQTNKPTIESLTKAIVAQLDVLGLPTFQGAPMRPSYQTDPNEGAIWVTWNGGASDYHIATVSERSDGRLTVKVYAEEVGEGIKRFNERKDGSEVGAAADFIHNTVFDLVRRWEDAYARRDARKVADAQIRARLDAGRPGGYVATGPAFTVPLLDAAGKAVAVMKVEPDASANRADYVATVLIRAPMAEGLDALVDRIEALFSKWGAE